MTRLDRSESDLRLRSNAKTRYADISAKLTAATLSAKTAAIGNSLAMLEQKTFRNKSRNEIAIEHLEDSNGESLTLCRRWPFLTRGCSITETADGHILLATRTID